MAETVDFNRIIPKVVGVKRAGYALVNEDTADKLSHGEVKALTRCRKVALAPGYAEQELNSNDSVEEGGNEIASYTVTLDASGMTQETEAEIYGHSIDENGLMVEKDGDQAPKLALLLELSMSKGNSKFVVLYCGTAKHPSEEAESKTKTGFTFGLPSIEFSFSKAMNGNLKSSIRTDSEQYKPEIGNSWFTEVKYPTEVPTEVGGEG